MDTLAELSSPLGGRLLTHSELQEAVDSENEATQHRNEHKISGIELVNSCVKQGGAGVGLAEALAAVGLTIARREEVRCLIEMEHMIANKSHVEGTDMELWMEDIEEAVRYLAINKEIVLG